MVKKSNEKTCSSCLYEAYHNDQRLVRDYFKLILILYLHKLVLFIQIFPFPILALLDEIAHQIFKYAVEVKSGKTVAKGGKKKSTRKVLGKKSLLSKVRGKTSSITRVRKKKSSIKSKVSIA